MIFCLLLTANTIVNSELWGSRNKFIFFELNEKKCILILWITLKSYYNYLILHAALLIWSYCFFTIIGLSIIDVYRDSIVNKYFLFLGVFWCR